MRRTKRALASLISIVGATLVSSPYHAVFETAVLAALVAGVVGCFNLFRATRLSMMKFTKEAMLIRSRFARPTKALVQR